jgi:hypothetical protein
LDWLKVLSSETTTLASTASMGGLQLGLSLSSMLQKRENLFLISWFFVVQINPSNVISHVKIL